ncbi:MAG: PorV/PorQ family protein [Endomicrobiales bacterium]|nr:PorV/PorQ family protein [Endomicrobiales bacterium]
MRKLSMVLLCLTVGTCMVFGMFSSDDAGTSAAQFLKLGVGARPAGMGESFAGVADDSTAIYWNPSGLNQIEKKSLSAMHAIWFEDISYDWVSYAQPTKYGPVGVGIQYVSYGSIDGMDASGNATGFFVSSDYALILSYAREEYSIPLGVNLKYISSKIEDETASAFAIDIGGMYKLMEDRLSCGLVLQNIGTKMKYISEEDPLPFNIKMGGSYNIRENWIGVLDINMPRDNDINFGLGSEYVYEINSELDASGRIGYNTRNKDTGGTNGLSLGVGVVYNTYGIDYAFAPFGDLGSTHRISLSVSF